MSTVKNYKNAPQAGRSPEEKNKATSLPFVAMPFQTGIAGNPMFESVPKYLQAPCEKVIKGKGDCYIVLGRDRVGNLLQGKAGKGDAKAAAIDIVVGRWSGTVPEVNSKGKPLYLNPSFQKDAARIYISQKTDIDKSFGIAKGKVGNFENRSGIALKADGIRLLSREGIKLVTRNDTVNSKNLKTLSHGIDLIALNDDRDLQPIPKGNNLAQSLKRLSHHVIALNKLVKDFVLYQAKFNYSVAMHTHISPFTGVLQTLPSAALIEEGGLVAQGLNEEVDEGLTKNRKNVHMFKLTYLNKNGKRYINSKFNNTN